jgi:hypothetical protein
MDFQRLVRLVADVPIFFVVVLVAILLVIALCALRGLRFPWINDRRWLSIALALAGIFVVAARLIAPRMRASEGPIAGPSVNDVPAGGPSPTLDLSSATPSGSSLMVTGTVSIGKPGEQVSVYRRAVGRGQRVSAWRRAGSLLVDSAGRFEGTVPLREAYEDVDQIEVTVVLATPPPADVLPEHELGRYPLTVARVVTAPSIGASIDSIEGKRLGTPVDIAKSRALLVGGQTHALVEGPRSETLWVRLQSATGCAQAPADPRGAAGWLARLPLPTPSPREFALSLLISTLRPDCERAPLGVVVRCHATGRGLICADPAAASGTPL